MSRRAEISRRSGETRVEVRLEIDGNGRFDVSIPDPFMKHMLETLTWYAQFDLTLKAQGDIGHHIIEDVAISLGVCLRKAIGDTPVERVAHAVVPMDDALVMVALDIIDRPYLDIKYTREKVKMDEMHIHFFRSFAMEGRLCIHIVVLSGIDGHHITESAFKALGIALRRALVPKQGGLSTKGRVDWRGV